MKNYFIIHALGNTSKDHWYQFVKNQIEKKGFKVYSPTLPPIERMSYNSWSKAFNKYKKFINEESVFIGHSSGSIFSVKYLMTNNLHIQKFIGVVSFNECNVDSPHPDWEEINKSFFVDNLKEFQKFAKERICFYSPTDIYTFELLDNFATEINAKKVIIQDAGHFTKSSGYSDNFEEILEYL